MRIISKSQLCEISFKSHKYASFYFLRLRAVHISFLSFAQRKFWEFPERLYIILCRTVPRYLTTTRASLLRTYSFYYYRSFVLIILCQISLWHVLIQTRAWNSTQIRRESTFDGIFNFPWIFIQYYRSVTIFSRRNQQESLSVVSKLTFIIMLPGFSTFSSTLILTSIAWMYASPRLSDVIVHFAALQISA